MPKIKPEENIKNSNLIQNQEIQEKKEIQEELEEILPFKYSITSYGADYAVEMLVKRMSEGAILVPKFQRDYVWNPKQASRFVESLLLGLPVPGIFLYKEENSQKLVVIDGQQRLRTLQYFYEGIFPKTEKEFFLINVQGVFEGKTYKTLEEEDRRRLDDSIIHATIIKQDKPSEDDSSIYHIFERINTEGLLLQPQEIRACIYHGKFNDLIKELNQNRDWRGIFGSPHVRMRDQELILRFLALYFNFERYEKPMKAFLNIFMGVNRNLKDRNFEKEAKKLFYNTIHTIGEYIGNNAFRPEGRLIAFIFDAIMVGVARRLKVVGEIKNRENFVRSYNSLLENKRFMNSSTSDDISVATRMRLAVEAFSNVS